MRVHYDTTACGRCGGCGEYSYNQRDGSRCWGCSGTGRVLTRAGQAARETLSSSVPRVPVTDVEPGQRVLVPRVGWVTIDESYPDELNDTHHVLSYQRGGYVNRWMPFASDTIVRAMSDDERAAYHELARSLDGADVR